MAISLNREDFGKGLSLADKAVKCKAEVERLHATARKLNGDRDLSPQMVLACADLSRWQVYASEIAQRIREAEAERRAREVAAEKAAKLAEMMEKVMPILVARIGSSDPSKLAAAFAEMVQTASKADAK